MTKDTLKMRKDTPQDAGGYPQGLQLQFWKGKFWFKQPS